MRVQGAAGIVITEKPMTHDERRILEACAEVCRIVALELLSRINAHSETPPEHLKGVREELRYKLSELIKDLSR